MDRTEYEEFLARERDVIEPTISVKEVVEQVLPGADISLPVTLLYGYTVERHSFHVYLDREQTTGCPILVRLIYTGGQSSSAADIVSAIGGTSLHAHLLTPDKRVYPESTLAGFLALLESKGVEACVTTFSDERYERVRDLRVHGATQWPSPRWVEED